MQSPSIGPAAPTALPPLTLGNLAASAAGFGMVVMSRHIASLAEHRNPPLGAFVTVGDVRLHYLERGSGPSIVLLHGNGTMIEDWIVSGVFGELAKTHRVIAIDRPGFGHSTRPRSRMWTPRAQASVIAAALGQLGVEQASIVGHSLGALVALALALDAPSLVSRLTLVSGYYYPTPRFDALVAVPQTLPVLGDLIGHTLSPMLGKVLEPVVNHQLFGPSPVPTQWLREFPMAMALRPSQIRAGAADSAMIMFAAGQLAQEYHKLQHPLTIVAGAGDRIVGPAAQSIRFHANLPHTELIVISESGHMVHHTDTPRVLHAISARAAGRA